LFLGLNTILTIEEPIELATIAGPDGAPDDVRAEVRSINDWMF
jgi:hypothetical protein